MLAIHAVQCHKVETSQKVCSRHSRFLSLPVTHLCTLTYTDICKAVPTKAICHCFQKELYLTTCSKSICLA